MQILHGRIFALGITSSSVSFAIGSGRRHTTPMGYTITVLADQLP